MGTEEGSMALSEQDIADIRAIAEEPHGLGLNPHSTLKLLRAYEALRATLDDIGRGSTHELVRHWIDTTVKAEARADAAERDNASFARQAYDAGMALIAERAETARLRSAVPFPGDPDRVATLARKLLTVETRLAAATELLVDWENYDPDDEEGSSAWSDRRDRFLAAEPAPAKEEP